MRPRKKRVPNILEYNIQEGYVPLFAFRAFVRELLRENNEEFPSPHEIFKALAEKSGRKAVEEFYSSKQACPEKLYKGLVSLVAENGNGNGSDIPPEQSVHGPFEYYPSQKYEIGDILLLHRCMGVVVKKILGDKRIVVELESGRRRVYGMNTKHMANWNNADPDRRYFMYQFYGRG